MTVGLCCIEDTWPPGWALCLASCRARCVDSTISRELPELWEDVQNDEE